ncbi:hypothetical protein Q5692_13105 [Microcoleus sp. C2C3]|uniref:hypothetical protein n=1 Tax=unclassified Microcoleus TaxID=2642155 RepID=UPI002FD22F1F
MTVDAANSEQSTVNRQHHFGVTGNDIKQHLGNILVWLRDRTANQTDYAAVNLLNLSSNLKTDIRGFDCS